MEEVSRRPDNVPVKFDIISQWSPARSVQFCGELSISRLGR